MIDASRIRADSIAERIALARAEVGEAAQELEAAEARFERARLALRPLLRGRHTPPEARR